MLPHFQLHHTITLSLSQSSENKVTLLSFLCKEKSAEQSIMPGIENA